MSRSYPNIRRAVVWVVACYFVALAFAQRNDTGGRLSAASDGRIYCANDSGRVMCTDDGGKTWYEFDTLHKRRLRGPESAASKPLIQRIFASHKSGDGDKPKPVVSSTAVSARPIEAVAGLPKRKTWEIVAAVIVNGHVVDDAAHLLEDNSGRFYAQSEIFSGGRVKLPGSTAVRSDGQDFYSLDGIPGVSYSFDSHSQSLAVTATSSELVENVLGFSPRTRLEPTIPKPGVFLNHDFQFTRSPGQSILSGLVETGFFSRLGVLTSRFVTRNIADASQAFRLDTQLITDFPHHRMTMTIGDSISASGPWERQVYYGGFRIASKFATDPTFLPYALPSLRGQTAEPSTVDLYVNNIHMLSQSVDSGPFTIPTIPVMTGQGNVQLVVTDVLGRQEVVEMPYINSTQLLRKGVSNYAYEAGTLRRGFGTTSGQYSSIFGAGTHSYGLSDSITLDGHVEALPANQTIGFGADIRALPLGLLSADVALSHSNAGAGGLVYAQMQHHARTFGFSATAQVASSSFRQMGLLPGERPARILAQGQISHSLGNHGSVALGYLHKESRTFIGTALYDYVPRFNAVTPSLSVRLRRWAVLSATLNYAPSIPQGNSGILALVIPLGMRRSVTSVGSMQNTGGTAATEFMQQLPIGTGYGYDLRTTTDSDNHTRVDVGASYQNERGTYNIEAEQFLRQTSVRLEERGSLLGMSNRWATSRWLNDSFAIVEAPEEKDLKVFANNQFITKTDSHGIAVIPALVPYDRNTVRVDDSGVPLNVAVDLSEQFVAPMPRSGVFLRFAAEKIQGALVKLMLADGKPVPLGAEVRVNDSLTPYQVAMRGEVFVTKISFPARLTARWDDHSCVAIVAQSPVNEPLPEIGPVTCEVKP